LNSRLWTWNRPKLTHVIDQVSIGRFPSKKDISASEAASVIDLTAELHSCGRRPAWSCFPTLDLIPPSADVLQRAALKIEQSRSYGPVLVSCALGYSRSACAIATWLLISGRASTVNNAISVVRAAQNKLVLGQEELERIADAAGNRDL
jgi:protein-tyrosine phosphatase